ncbi:MAG: hypothetical protein ACLFPN_01980 [Methanomassiliicoccales archaeon]
MTRSPHIDRNGGKIYLASPPPGKERRPGGCGIAGCIATNGGTISGDTITRMITTMSERENGLGAGYAGYGLFPDRRDEFCLQFIFDDEEAKSRTEEFLKDNVYITGDERVFTKKVTTLSPPYPLVWRFFAIVKERLDWPRGPAFDPEDRVAELAMRINRDLEGAYCVSSGKDMAVFKGCGYSGEIAEFYDISRYQGKMWLSHSRFPTNSPGWWAGAHPINLLDWSVCHNGEITSYGVNRKLVEMAGYECTLLTDTEVITYLWDMLVRKHHLPVPVAAFAMAPWYYPLIEGMDEKSKRLATWLRIVYKEAFLNGPFSILVGRREPECTMIAMADRKKLRPLVAGISPSEGCVFAASEECAIRSVEHSARIWTADAGSPVIARADRGLVRKGTEHPFQEVKV